MIFVTVGTHEQPFDRLIQQVDALCADGTLTGYAGGVERKRFLLALEGALPVRK